MAAVITSMPLTVGERQSKPVGEMAHAQDSSSAADAKAREIATRVAKGDENAFRELYDCYHSRVFRLGLVIGGGDEELAHETVQSVFLTAASKLRRVDSEAHLWNWLAKIARQQIGKAWRQKGRDAAIVPMAELPEFSRAGESDSAAEEKLDAALLSMEPEERQLIEWFYFDRLSHKEIAERLSATPKAVSSRLERTRAKLRAFLTRQTKYET